MRRAEGAARRSGIFPGDIILAVNGQPMRTLEDLNAGLAKTRSGEIAALLVDRRGSRAFVPLWVP